MKTRTEKNNIVVAKWLSVFKNSVPFVLLPWAALVVVIKTNDGQRLAHWQFDIIKLLFVLTGSIAIECLYIYFRQSVKLDKKSYPSAVLLFFHVVVAVTMYCVYAGYLPLAL